MKTITERTTAALAWIDSQLAICNAATAGQWAVDSARGVMAVGLGWSPICYPFGSVETEYNDAAFIAAARTGYPAMLEGMKESLKMLADEVDDSMPYCFADRILESILPKIEALR